MPYSNAVGVTPASLASIAAYLSDIDHSHHKDYQLTPIQVLGAKSVQQFIDFAKAGFKANRKKAKAGRPPKNAATWFICRMPDGTNLAPREMAAYEHAAREMAGLGSPIVGIMNWHRNLYTGAADMNLLAVTFTANGDLVRDRKTHPIKLLRWRMDQVTDELNAVRKSRGPLITTMQQVKRERAQERGEADLVEELALLPKRPSRIQDLKPACLSLGYEVPRFQPKLDYMSVKPTGKTRAKRFRISGLLEQVEVFFQRVKALRKTSEEPTKPPTYSTEEMPEIIPPLIERQGTPVAPGDPTTSKSTHVKKVTTTTPDGPTGQ